MVQKPLKKKKRKLPEDALKRDDRHLMECIFGKEVMTELDKMTLEKPKKKVKIDTEPFM